MKTSAPLHRGVDHVSPQPQVHQVDREHEGLPNRGIHCGTVALWVEPV